MAERGYKPIHPQEIQDTDVRGIIRGLIWFVMGKPNIKLAEEFEKIKLCGLCYYPFISKDDNRPSRCLNQDCKRLIDWS
jgi:hypothetical protein